ncbi:MAG: hypothetical protein ABI675_19640 [Chitinophagaceae bacterium]
MIMCFDGADIIMAFVFAFVIQVIGAIPAFAGCTGERYTTKTIQHLPKRKIIINNSTDLRFVYLILHPLPYCRCNYRRKIFDREQTAGMIFPGFYVLMAHVKRIDQYFINGCIAGTTEAPGNSFPTNNSWGNV